MIEVMVALAIWSTLLLGIGMLRGELTSRSWAKLVLLPGLLLEAAGRGLACLVTATPIERFSLFADGEPLLRNGRCPVQRIGVPIGMGIRLVFFFLTAFILLAKLPLFIDGGFSLPHLNPVGKEGTLSVFLTGLQSLPGQLELSTGSGLLLLWILVSTVIATGLSSLEWIASMWAWGGLVGGAWLAQWLGVRFGTLSRGWFIERWWGPEVWATLSLLVILAAACLGALALMHAIPVITQKLRPKPDPEPMGLQPTEL